MRQLKRRNCDCADPRAAWFRPSEGAGLRPQVGPQSPAPSRRSRSVIPSQDVI